LIPVITGLPENRKSPQITADPITPQVLKCIAIYITL